MRVYVIGLVVAGLSAEAFADRTKSDGGGRLDKVTSGINKAASEPRPSSSGGTRDHRSSSDDHRVDTHNDHDSTAYYTSSYSSVGGCFDCTPSPARRGPPRPPIRVDVDGSAVAQMVYESDYSLSAELGVTFERKLRLAASASHYLEDQPSGARSTLTMPTLQIGLRIGDLGATRFWVEGGLSALRSNDDAGGSATLFGSALGGRVEYRPPSGLAVFAGGGAMLYENMQAYTARAGVRISHVEAAFRFLDFSVGPALFGPELGIAF